jgi:hypothetical protein
MAPRYRRQALAGVRLVAEHLVSRALQLPFVDQQPRLGVRVKRMSALEALRAGDPLFHEKLSDTVSSTAGAAFLAFVYLNPASAPFECCVELGIT